MNPISIQNYSTSIDSKNFKIISTNSATKKIKFSVELKGKYKYIDAQIRYGRVDGTRLLVDKVKILDEIFYNDYTLLTFELNVSQYFLDRTIIFPEVNSNDFYLDLTSNIEGVNLYNTNLFNYYPDDPNYPFSETIDVKDFKITSITSGKIFYEFNLKGKYGPLDLYVYHDKIESGKMLFHSRLDELETPIFYPEYVVQKHWNTDWKNHGKISGKYFLVIDYWYNGVKQTKTLEFSKEPDNNDLAILNVRMQEDYPGAKPFEVKPNSNITLKVASYRVFVTVANNGTSNLEEGIKIEAKGFHPSGPRHINSSGKIPFILKGLQAEAIFNMVAPLSPNYSIGTTILNNELEIKLDPSNSLKDTNLANNSFKIKYTFNNSMPGAKSNIDVYDSSGNKIKSTSVNDLEKGVQEIKKSLPKGHYYFNIDGEKTQVKIQ
ncbi:hypothetical protein [Empedobacter brevis]|uniref:hypothetical protein n=1 Tax=Empedobacter brevis TaxID=247 RepID=UPI0028A9EA71|nr:hypothetical protein [Empedobacter brevis]